MENSRVLINFAILNANWRNGKNYLDSLVPFEITVKVPDTYIGPATLVLHKDNPSDMRQYDASISFPITIEY